MVYGIGIDTVSVSRIAGLIKRYGRRFLERIYSADEIAEGTSRRGGAEFFAARFAAREAFFKALGTGWGRGIALKDVSVTRNKLGRPSLSLSGRAEIAVKDLRIERSHLSLTHEGDIAQGIVILEGGGDE